MAVARSTLTAIAFWAQLCKPLDMTETDGTPGAAAVASYQHWHGIPTFLKCSPDPDLSVAEVGLVGVPLAVGNGIERGQYLGPRAVRTMSMGHHRSHRAMRFDPFAACEIRDLGDVTAVNALRMPLAIDDVTSFFRRVDAQGIRPVSVGGDHSVLIGILRGIAGAGSGVGGPVGLVHFDAHTDYYPSLAPDGFVHGGAFNLLVEEGQVDPHRMVQIGVRGPMASLAQDDAAHAAGIRVIEQTELDEIGPDRVVQEVRRVVGEGPVYVTFDLDALDPIYAPAVADPEAAGMSIKDALRILQGLRGLDIIGGDVVEFCPAHDVRGGPSGGGLTTYHATTLFYELVCLVADRVAAGGGSPG